MSLSIQAFDAHVFLVKEAGPQCGPGAEGSSQHLSQRRGGVLPPGGGGAGTTPSQGFGFPRFLSPHFKCQGTKRLTRS